MKTAALILATAILSSASGFLISDSGALNMTTKTAHTIKEPLLIAGEQKYYSILPAGTVLYFGRAWPEGHQTYHVYFHFKGDFKTNPADTNMISPLWLRTVDPEELSKPLKDYPGTKKELVEIIKARKKSPKQSLCKSSENGQTNSAVYQRERLPKTCLCGKL